MADLTAAGIAGRIEDLYGEPLADLKAHPEARRPGMLAALLGMHQALADAEHSITFHRDYLTRLLQPGRRLGPHEVSHLLDGTRRLAEAVAVHDVQAASAAAVLQSLTRVAASPPTREPPSPPPRSTAVARSR
ncbi:hypothetical protein [Streptomyces sp. CMB-StM0423]|uniref:hypothetical protein n=1 Tax=Streptomyces sp. CMB-StM0423 TaxID=2059884 RepID=UPI000C70A4AC|nr:hypothetical protein [Streptomyces sp. CMB-StM0423]AUH40505.1 hypothetical protein CXR04_09810 [Streptomyces sp. CMB-StM0423]